MYKKSIRVFCFLIILSLVLTSPSFIQPCFARNSDYIDSYGAYLYSPNSNTVQVWFELKANYTSDKVGVTTIILQVSDDLENWENVGTYKDDDYPYLMASNTIGLDSHISVSVESGHYYRAGLVFYVERDGGSDTRFYDTEPIWI